MIEFWIFAEYCYCICHNILSVSNEIPEHPVICPISGHIYERRLIEKYIRENGTEPMTGEKITIDMLVDIKGENFANCKPYFSLKFMG